MRDSQIEPTIIDILDEIWGPQVTDFESIATWALDEACAGEHAHGIVAGVAMWLFFHGDARARHHGEHLLHRFASAGIPAAAFNLAIEKLKGDRLPQDIDGANGLLRWIIEDKPRDPGLLPMAMAALADSHREGRGMPQGHNEALALYVQAADTGFAPAAYAAGLYFNGKMPGSGIRQDNDRAARYYAIAAEQGDVKARTNLGCLHALEALTAPDPVYGDRLLRMSLAEGDTEAGRVLELVAQLRAELPARNDSEPPTDAREEEDTDEELLELLAEAAGLSAEDLHSSIAMGEFAPGEQLPWKHPDQIRIMNALEGLGPDAPLDPPRILAPGELSALGETSLNDALAEAQREMDAFPGGMEAYLRDHHYKTFLLNFLSEHRASGTMPDKVFAMLLERIRTPDGRHKVITGIGSMIGADG